MKICKNCGNKQENNQRFCSECGHDNLSDQNKNNNNKNKNKKITIAIIVVVIFIIGFSFVLFPFKDSILQAYYVKKGNNEKANNAIDYYCKALEIKYSDEVVDKIEDKISESDEPENQIERIEDILERKDLEKLYVKVYVDKAKENFNKENYKTSRKYLDMAKKYNYNENDFEYYEDLKAIEKDEEDKIKEEKLEQANQEKETVYVVENNHYSYNYDTSYSGDYGYFIIPDSNSRYLTKEELLSYNKSQLGYIRNEIFARYGYIFKNKVYRDYFNSMPWYYPDSTFSGSISGLNSIEQHNVNLIKSLE